MSPKQVVEAWVVAFNNANADLISNYYHADAVNHQVPVGKAVGRDAIRDKFAEEFSAAEMVCIIENLFEDGEWAILEWRDPLGLRGCGFFHVEEGKIRFQRGYWDKLTFMEQQGAG